MQICFNVISRRILSGVRLPQPNRRKAPRMRKEKVHPSGVNLKNGSAQSGTMSTMKVIGTPMGLLGLSLYFGKRVRGYFHWSLTDNLEWHHGFRPRFGLIYINYTTQQRIPKLSAQWFKELIRTGRIS